MSQPVAIVKDLYMSFKGADSPALIDMSTEIFAGRITGLVGPDGAGKTTFIRLMMGIMRQKSGTITIDGLDTVKQSEEIHNIAGYMPQKFGLYEDLTVIENLQLYADLRNVVGQERKDKFEQLLSFTGLKDFQKRLAGKLSGGMKQKLGLACSILGKPKLLLLDEPSVGVDPVSRRELWRMVQEFCSEGMAVLWSTSYLDEAEKCDSVILLNQGNKLFDGPPSGLLERVNGRVWQVQGIEEDKRRNELKRLLAVDSVVDGVIQGRNLRIVLKRGSSQPQQDRGSWVKAEPRFEDAFVDILGGSPKGESAIVDGIAQKEKQDKPVIRSLSLTKVFGDFVAVKDNTFEIKQGEIFGLLGPNGAGKSTTFKMMCGLIQPTSGTASVAGLNLKTATSLARSRIGYMAQKFSLYGNLSVRQNLSFFSGLYGLTGKKQKKQIESMIDIFDFHHHLKVEAQELPLGYKQRLALACSVMHQPDVLFLDEPTSGIDPITRREFWNHINSLVEKGVTIMVTTHFMDEAEYCDRIGLIYRGENIATDTPDNLKKMVVSNEHPDPTLEEAFIEIIHRHDMGKEGRQTA